MIAGHEKALQSVELVEHLGVAPEKGHLVVDELLAPLFLGDDQLG